MRNICLIFLIAAAPMLVKSQSNLDSLLTVWQDHTQPDTSRVRAFQAYIWNGFLFSRPDSAYVLAGQLIDFSTKIDHLKGQAIGNNIQGISFDLRGDYMNAIDRYENCLAIYEITEDRRGMARTLNNIGLCYRSQSIYPKALDYFQRSLAISEKDKDTGGMDMALNNIGIIHEERGELAKALEYFDRSLQLSERNGDVRGVATAQTNIAVIHKGMGDEALALDFFQRALAVHEKNGDLKGVSSVLNNIGIIYHDRKDAQAITWFERALSINEALDDQRMIAMTLNNIGRTRLMKGEYAKAMDFCTRGWEIAGRIGASDKLKNSCECLYETYRSMGNSAKALEYFEQMVLLKDSLFNEENTKKITRLEMQYDFDKQEAATRAEQEKKDAVAAQELRRQKVVRNGFMGGFALVAVFAGIFLLQRNRISKEKARSEDLLLNILPEEVADELKEKGEADAKLIEQVTVLFTDFKGFTAMSEKLSPKELVKDLHECFSAFDRICEEHGLEKIKTIGDAYMAAGGLPTPNTTHATDVINAALAMRDFVAAGKEEKIAVGLPYFEIRIGLHTGPVVAGIVGMKKFSYDIWGDTVNTASRMESSGEVGQVNISEATYGLVKDAKKVNGGEWELANGGKPEAGISHSPFTNSHSPAFTFTPRGKIQAKGKGELEMYFVNDRA